MKLVLILFYYIFSKRRMAIMKMTKRISSLIAALLLVTTFNSYSMEEQKSSGWMALVGGVLLGAVAIKMLWQSQPSDPFPFTQLPKDMRDQIILLLTLDTQASSLKEAAKTINSLAQVNKELNKFINDPVFCLKLIKHLAEKFNCTDEEAAEELHIQEAKRRLKIQHQLLYMLLNGCYYIKNETVITPEATLFLDSAYEQGIDLGFTYEHNGSIPLMFTNVGFLRYVMFQKLCSIMKQHKLFNLLNQPDKRGNTPLINLCRRGAHSWFVKTIIDAGADPELANFDGLTPLAAAEKQLEGLTPERAAQHTDDQKTIDIIKAAIAKKHGQK